MLNIWMYVQTETAPKSMNWQAPGAKGSPYLDSRCIFCKKSRKGVAGRLVDHIVGETGTALCGGPQREKDETTAIFNERLKEYKDAKEGFIKEREKKRSTKASVEMFSPNKKQRDEVLNSNQYRIEEFGFSSSGTNTFGDTEVTQRLVRGLISEHAFCSAWDHQPQQSAGAFRLAPWP